MVCVRAALILKALKYEFKLTVSVYSSANSLESKETYQLDGVNFDATLYSLKIFPEIFVTFTKKT